jgi:hypothetical protein
MQRKEPFFRPAVTAEDKLREYRETLIRLQEIAAASPLHPVSVQVIRNCLALIELCWAVPTNESRDAVVGQMKRMADTMRAQSETFRSAGTEPLARRA